MSQYADEVLPVFERLLVADGLLETSFPKM